MNELANVLGQIVGILFVLGIVAVAVWRIVKKPKV